MARYTDTLRDQNLRPVAGALVSVVNYAGVAAALTDDDDQPLDNPFYTDEYGGFTFNTSDGQYTLSFRYGGREVYSEEVTVGTLIANLSPDPTNGGKYLALDAVGVATYSVGTGNDPAFRTDMAANAGPLSGVKPERIGGTPYRVDDAFKFSIRLTAFGFKGDGATDDTAAWRAAIAFAGARNISDIIVPAGISLVTGSIVNSANPLPQGLTFRGESPGSTLSNYPSRLRYTGTGACWDVSYPTGAPNFSGNWTWEAMTFECTDPAGTMFSFGDPLTHTPSDNPGLDPYRYLMAIEFRRIVAYGPQGTGDFLRACKAFAINVDSYSIVNSFRRAFWLKGCDNCRIECRMVGNNRAIMNEASGTFGNNTHIDVNYIGAPPASFGGEAAYSVYDTGSGTYIGRSCLLEGDGNTAHLYLGGYGTIVDSPQYGANSPLFEVGPEARDVVITSPRVPTTNLAWAPIVNAPSSWAFGGSQTDHRVRVYDASLNFQFIVAAANTRGRILMVSGPDQGLGLPPANAPGVATTKGFLTPLVCSAANYWADGGIGGQQIEGIVSDVGASGKRAIKLSTTGGSGFGLQAKIGGRISAAPYKVSIRNKLSGPITTGGFIFIVTKNGAFSQALTVNTTTSYGRPTPDSVDLSSWADGDALAIQLYNQDTGLNMWVDYVALTPVAD